MIRKSSCTSVHCGFRIFANLEIPPFGLASLSHAPPCRVLSATPALPHCMPCIVSSIRIPPDASHALHCLDRSATPALSQCRVFIHHVLDVIARNRICPVFSILSYHTLLIRLIHSILFTSIPFYPILSLPSIPLHGSPGYTWHAFRAFPFPVSLRSIPPVTVSCIPAIEKGLHRKSTIQPLLGGERGIRTPVPLLATTRFPGVPLKPLEHLSKAGANILIIFICTKKCRSFGKSTRLIRQLQPVRLRKSLALWPLS